MNEGEIWPPIHISRKTNLIAMLVLDADFISFFATRKFLKIQKINENS